MNSVDPFRIEGYKVTGFEIFSQLDEKIPDWIFAPVSSGGHLIGLMRAFLDLKSQGWTQKMPTFVGVQARGCSPIARAFSAGKPKFRRWEKGRTIAHAISNPDPPGGNLALKLIRENGGRILSVTDREILSALRILAAEEGLFCEAASSTTLAALLKLAEARLLKKGQTAVLVITGSGLKTLADIKGVRLRIPQVSLSQIEEKIIQFIKGGTNER
jgi:threonine synthase